MLSLIWLIFVAAVSIVLHELGHAWAAKLCRFDVSAIRFGVGKPIRKWRWEHIEITIALPVFVGLVEYSDRGRGTIAQRLFVAASGLIANALLVIIASLGDSYLHVLDNYWSLLGVANMIIIVINLFPFVVMRAGSYSKVWSDGGQILGLIQEKFTGRNFAQYR